MQEVLVAVLNDLPKIQHNPRTGAFRSWLRTILVNRVREFWRARIPKVVATNICGSDQHMVYAHKDDG